MSFAAPIIDVNSFAADVISSKRGCHQHCCPMLMTSSFFSGHHCYLPEIDSSSEWKTDTQKKLVAIEGPF
jgi:hypothetical protein